MRVTTKTGKKRQGESNDQEKKEKRQVLKNDNQCEIGPLLHEKMPEIICSNFPFQISQTTSKKIQEKFLLLRNCPLSIPLVNSEFWRIMSSNKRKGDFRLATL